MRVEAPEQRDDLADGLLVGKPGFLKRHADPLANGDRVGTPADRPRTSTSPEVGLIQALEDLDGRRLAGAVGAEQPEALAGLDLEVDAVDGMDRAISPGILLAQVLDANRPIAIRSPPSSIETFLAGSEIIRSPSVSRWQTWGSRRRRRESRESGALPTPTSRVR